MKKLVITIIQEEAKSGGFNTQTTYDGDKSLKSILLEDTLNDLQMVLRQRKYLGNRFTKALLNIFG